MNFSGDGSDVSIHISIELNDSFNSSGSFQEDMFIDSDIDSTSSISDNSSHQDACEGVEQSNCGNDGTDELIYEGAKITQQSLILHIVCPETSFDKQCPGWFFENDELAFPKYGSSVKIFVPQKVSSA